jgi:hypothetical protein
MADVKWPAALVRKTFFDYFEQKGHTLGMFPTCTAQGDLDEASHGIQIYENLFLPFPIMLLQPILTFQMQCLLAHRSLTMTPPYSSPMRA